MADRLKRARIGVFQPEAAPRRAARQRREEFGAKISAVRPEDLIFLDESGVKSSMTRR
jgi:hypothetical protein